MRHFSISASFALCLLRASHATIGPVTELNIVNAVAQPDGIPRQAVLADGQFPGPLITGKKGDNFKINVVNKLTNETMLTDTTVHWHGIYQKHTSWADGTALISQCPIVTGHSFSYEFPAGDQAGTFWYHSNIRTQYCDGLRGPMVIYDPYDPYLPYYDVDDESTVITLADWYHTAQPVNTLADPPAILDSVVINGQGRFAGGGNSPLAVISVEYGKKYRFRLIALSCDAAYDFSIDQHQMKIIEADGELTKPLVVDSLKIYAGQRYSFILEANQQVGNYWIRANPGIGPMGYDGGINSATLRYVGAKEEDPTTSLITSTMPLVEADLKAFHAGGVPGLPEPGGVDIPLSLNLTFNATEGKLYINGASFTPPPTPILLQILSGAKDPRDLLPAGSIYPISRGKTVEVTFLNGDIAGGNHPFHLHGQSFYVVRSSNSSDYNFVDPPLRDVVSTGSTGGHTTFRFTADNPGPWVLRCHIDPHYDRGFAIVFVDDSQDISSDTHRPAAWDDLCKAYNAKHSIST